MGYTDEQIGRARAWDIVEVAGRLSLPLKRKGSTWMMCCVAHDERTPSMQVGGKRNIAKCYACGKVLDTVGLVMDHENCTFPEAIRFIINEEPAEGEKERKQSKLYLRQRPVQVQNGVRPHFAKEETFLAGFMPEDVNAMVSVQNPLSQCLLQRFPKEDVERVTYLYRLGLWYDREHYARTAFPLIDRDGRVHDVKVQRYETRVDDPRFGHSVGGTFWLGKTLSPASPVKGEELCSGSVSLSRFPTDGREPVFTHDVLFGEHLLARHPERLVGLVESPKNAVVAACAFPDMTWVATGNKGMLKREVLAPLANREVLVFPDKDAMEDWSEKLRGMQDLAHFVVSDVGQTEAEKSDIADRLMNL